MKTDHNCFSYPFIFKLDHEKQILFMYFLLEHAICIFLMVKEEQDIWEMVDPEGEVPRIWIFYKGIMRRMLWFNLIPGLVLLQLIFSLEALAKPYFLPKDSYVHILVELHSRKSLGKQNNCSPEEFLSGVRCFSRFICHLGSLFRAISLSGFRKDLSSTILHILNSLWDVYGPQCRRSILCYEDKV